MGDPRGRKRKYKKSRKKHPGYVHFDDVVVVFPGPHGADLKELWGAVGQGDWATADKVLYQAYGDDYLTENEEAAHVILEARPDDFHGTWIDAYVKPRKIPRST